MTAVAYIRVSTEEQANGGLSLEDQEQRARDYAKSAGLGDPVILRERGVSGSIPLVKRPQGKILAAALAPTGSCKHVIAYKLDRLFRDTEDCLGRIREWEAGKEARAQRQAAELSKRRAVVGRMRDGEPMTVFEQILKGVGQETDLLTSLGYAGASVYDRPEAEQEEKESGEEDSTP